MKVTHILQNLKFMYTKQTQGLFRYTTCVTQYSRKLLKWTVILVDTVVQSS